MKKILVICAATAIAPIAAADLVEITFDMAGTSIDDPSFVYGMTQEQNLYAGESIVAVGVRNVVVDFASGLDSPSINFAWALDLNNAGYGAGIFYLAGASGPFAPGSQELFNIEYDVAQYGAQVLGADYYGDWNMGTFIGSDTGGGAVSIVSGEMYYVLDTNIPAPGALALLGLAGMASRRRRG
jgi:XapX domain-containing protein